MSWIKKYYQTIVIVLISLVVVLLAVWPLFHSGFPKNHDQNLYMTWLYEFDQGIMDGQLLPRWASNVWAGYGSPIFNFIQPGFYYIAESFHLFGLSLLNSVKAAIISAVFLSFLFMYLWSKEVWKNSWAALACATLYIWSPYHIGSIYSRGSLAELLAMAWWPLILYGVIKFISRRKFGYYLTIVVGSTLLFLSHTILTAFFLPVVIAYIIMHCWRRIKFGLLSLLGFILGAGISTFYWLPALAESRFLNIELLFSGNRNYINNFISIKQLVYTDWERYYLLIGLTGLIVLVLALYALIKKRRVESINSSKHWLWFYVLLFSIFFACWPAKFIWDKISLLRFIQFPWRLLSLVSLSIAIMGGMILVYKKSVQGWTRPFVLSLALVALTVLLNISYAQPTEYYRPYSDEDYRPFRERELEVKSAIQSGQKTIRVYFFSEMPEFFSTQTSLDSLEKILEQQVMQYTERLEQNIDTPITFPDKFEIVSGDVLIRSQVLKTSHYFLEFDAKEESVIKTNTLWFPGWKFYLDKEEVKPSITDELGTMDIHVPQGEHRLEIVFKNTPIRIIGNIVAYITVIFMIVLVCFRKYFNSLVNSITIKNP